MQCYCGCRQYRRSWFSKACSTCSHDVSQHYESSPSTSTLNPSTSSSGSSLGQQVTQWVSRRHGSHLVPPSQFLQVRESLGLFQTLPGDILRLLLLMLAPDDLVALLRTSRALFFLVSADDGCWARAIEEFPWSEQVSSFPAVPCCSRHSFVEKMAKEGLAGQLAGWRLKCKKIRLLAQSFGLSYADYAFLGLDQFTILKAKCRLAMREMEARPAQLELELVGSKVEVAEWAELAKANNSVLVARKHRTAVKQRQWLLEGISIAVSSLNEARKLNLIDFIEAKSLEALSLGSDASLWRQMAADKATAEKHDRDTLQPASIALTDLNEELVRLLNDPELTTLISSQALEFDEQRSVVSDEFHLDRLIYVAPLSIFAAMLRVPFGLILFLIFLAMCFAVFGVGPLRHLLKLAQSTRARSRRIKDKREELGIVGLEANVAKARIVLSGAQSTSTQLWGRYESVASTMSASLCAAQEMRVRLEKLHAAAFRSGNALGEAVPFSDWISEIMANVVTLGGAGREIERQSQLIRRKMDAAMLSSKK